MKKLTALLVTLIMFTSIVTAQTQFNGEMSTAIINQDNQTDVTMPYVGIDVGVNDWKLGINVSSDLTFKVEEMNFTYNMGMLNTDIIFGLQPTPYGITWDLRKPTVNMFSTVPGTISSTVTDGTANGIGLSTDLWLATLDVFYSNDINPYEEYLAYRVSSGMFGVSFDNQNNKTFDWKTDIVFGDSLSLNVMGEYDLDSDEDSYWTRATLNTPNNFIFTGGYNSDEDFEYGVGYKLEKDLFFIVDCSDSDVWTIRFTKTLF